MDDEGKAGDELRTRMFEQRNAHIRGASLSYTQRVGNQDLTWFALVKKLLNDDIRLWCVGCAPHSERPA